MPYIGKQAREELEGIVDTMHELEVLNPGELNYLFTMLIKTYLKTYGVNYASLNDCVGALECCKIELYRRVAASYEDEKAKENGDVYK